MKRKILAAVAAFAAWFVLAIANMSPPAPGLGQYLDRGGWSSATLLAGRPFHFHYKSVALKFLITVDIPAMVVMVPVGLAMVRVTQGRLQAL